MMSQRKNNKLEENGALRAALRWAAINQRITTLKNLYELLHAHPHRAHDLFDLVLQEAEGIVSELETIKKNGYRIAGAEVTDEA